MFGPQRSVGNIQQNKHFTERARIYMRMGLMEWILFVYIDLGLVGI